MKKISLFLITTLLAITTTAQAAKPTLPQVEYSADTVMETAEISMKGHVNYTPTRQRDERVMDGGDKMITITRRDKKMAWTLLPAQKMYMEMSLDKAKKEDKSDLSQFKIEQTVVGPETLNGVNTTKGKIIMTAADGTKMGGFMWVTKENIVVKMDVIALDKKDKMRFKTELTNLKIGKQEPKLFEIPPGYEKMGMGGMGGGFDMKDMMKMID